MSLFGCTYTCEYLLTGTHLVNSLRIALSQMWLNIEKLVSEKQCQLSH